MTDQEQQQIGAMGAEIKALADRFSGFDERMGKMETAVTGINLTLASNGGFWKALLLLGSIAASGAGIALTIAGLFFRQH